MLVSYILALGGLLNRVCRSRDPGRSSESTVKQDGGIESYRDRMLVLRPKGTDVAWPRQGVCVSMR
jgi:hypothetical protein